MASEVSSENVVRHLRVPAFARPHVPDSLATAPLLPQDLRQARQDHVYAIRLRDTFLSVPSAFAVERGWVKSAMLHAKAGLITHAPGKDSILLLWGIDGAVRKGTVDHVLFLDPTAHNEHTMTLELEEEDESTLAVQADLKSDLDVIQSMRGATIMKYKNYVAVKVPTSQLEVTLAKIRLLPSARIMPYEILSGADNQHFDNCITLQLRKEYDVSMLKQVSQTYYTYSPNKGQLRVYTPKAHDELVEQFKTLEGVQYILSASTLKTLFSSKTPLKPNDSSKTDQSQPKKGNMVIIKRLDATPISPHMAELLVKVLKLSKASVRDGALLGLTPDAQAMSGTVLNGKYLIAWEMEM